MMDNNYDSERLRGFDKRKTDRQLDICNTRVAFATENVHEKDKNKPSVKCNRIIGYK